MSKVRPTGITILVVFEVLASLILLIGGIGLIAVGGLVAGGMPLPIPGMFAGAFVSIFGGVLLVLGLVGFVVCWGMWTGKGWAWLIALILAVIGVLIGLTSLPGGIVGLLINGFIAYYLWQPHVKAFFGKEMQTPPLPPPQTMQPQPGAVIYCASCGTANPRESKFCSKCGTELKT